MRGSCQRTVGALSLVALGSAAMAQQVPATSATPPARTAESPGPLRTAKSGHVTNYDETKVGTYTLPDPLTLSTGEKVTNADEWFTKRRPEILDLYKQNVYGATPENAPALAFSVAGNVPEVLDGKGTAKYLEGHIGGGDGPIVHVLMVYPRAARGPVPVVLNLSFNAPPSFERTAATASAPETRAAVDNAPIAEILAHGYAYGTLRYTDIQPDNAKTFATGAIHPTLAAGEDRPHAGQWGTIGAWAWGVSRIVDYLETDSALDAKRIMLVGHSRLGKTVLWAGAQDTRIALVFSSCAGELGSSLARRDYGESVDDMIQSFPWQFTSTMSRYVAHWNDMPVDTHMLISLIAPRPLLITGGSRDQWADPRGEFLAEVAAGPVYRLLGKKDLGTDQQPALDVALTQGDLGFEEHTGAHTITPGDWKIFLDFADRHMQQGAGTDRTH